MLVQSQKSISYQALKERYELTGSTTFLLVPIKSHKGVDWLNFHREIALTCDKGRQPMDYCVILES